MSLVDLVNCRRYPIAALRDEVRNAGNHDASKAGHHDTPGNSLNGRQLSALSP
jgi:hypothetical protein